MTDKFHPAFKKASQSHRARNEREVKLGLEPTEPFFVGQSLEVVKKDRNTIVVMFFNGKDDMETRRLEVLDV